MEMAESEKLQLVRRIQGEKRKKMPFVIIWSHFLGSEADRMM